ncbi:RagB/SusD family nutrient uptake outer membrane protein [Marinilabiliaceae bacterium JC017]|nr:RagB/SusD family nutrient uptake outer membrane protein [Marinilabiliaceae bacterium JC017]
MKKIFAILTVLLGLFSGCEDVLEKTPYIGIPEDEMFKDAEGAQGALMGVYNSITHYNYYGRLIYAYEGAKGPDFYVENTGNRFEKENAYDESSSSGGYAPDAWKKIYSTVRQCNSLLANIEIIEGDADELRRIKGEALAIRGLAYFDLMRLFAYPPIFSCPDGEKYQEKYKMGVPLIITMKQTHGIPDNPPGRDDAVKCYDQIISDFTAATKNLEGITPEKGKVSYQAAQALLARAYLYLGQWDNARIAGEAALAEGGEMLVYGAYKTDYYKAFNDENIWELGYITSDNLSTNALNYLVRYPTIDSPGAPNDGEVADNVGYAGYNGNKYLKEVLRAIPSDVRSYLICNNRGGKEQGIRKYVGTEAHYLHNITMVRLPEVILTVAEAYAELKNLPKAEEYFNMVYSKRTGLEYTATAQEQTIKDILNDRRKELVLEGHTYWDYFRRAIPFTREAEGEVDEEKAYIDYSMPQVVYPIPQSEMDANPNIRNQQNPGYAAYVTD